MGQIRLTGANAAKALETLVPVDIIDLPMGMQRYAMFTNESGGILDDLMVANLGNDELFLVVNAACKDQDLAHLRKHIGDQCTIEPLFEERALLALQGPAAVTVLARLAPEVAKMTFMQFTRVKLLGVECFVSRSGYTGEDGFEISVPAQHAEALARALLAEPEVEAIGLGARDSLRLEAGPVPVWPRHEHRHHSDRSQPVVGHLQATPCRWRTGRWLPRRRDGIRPTTDRCRPQTCRPAAAGTHPGARRRRDRQRSRRDHRQRLQRRFRADPRRSFGDGLPRQRLYRARYAGLGDCSWQKGSFACKQNAICSTTLLSRLIDCSYK